MSDEWQLACVEDLAEVFDGPHATPTKTEHGPWYLSISSLKNGRVDLSESAHLSDKDFPTWTRRVQPKPGDTLFSYETRLGEAGHWSSEDRAALGRRMGLLRPHRDRVDPRFLTFAYIGPQFQAEIRRRSIHGATVDRIPIAEIGRWPIAVPPLGEQRRIADVLGAVDDLIDFNAVQVASLTSLVQAEFERRFGKRDLSLTIANVATVIDCLHSKKPERVPAGEVLLQLNNILDSGLLDLADTYLIEHDDYVRWTKNLETQQWDCVITNVGRVGAVARIPADVSAALGRNMTAVRPQQRNQDGAFIVSALRSPAVRHEIELRTDSGTILNSLNVRSIPKLRLQNASISERESFQAFAAPLLTLADSLHDESINLSRQRNELLPLLLSGQVRVEDVAA